MLLMIIWRVCSEDQSLSTRDFFLRRYCYYVMGNLHLKFGAVGSVINILADEGYKIS